MREYKGHQRIGVSDAARVCAHCGLPIEPYAPGATFLYWHHPVGNAHYRTCFFATRGTPDVERVMDANKMAEPTPSQVHGADL